jgi:hypothetical protein
MYKVWQSIFHAMQDIILQIAEIQESDVSLFSFSFSFFFFYKKKNIYIKKKKGGEMKERKRAMFQLLSPFYLFNSSLWEGPKPH